MHLDEAGGSFSRRRHVRLQMPAEEGAFIRILAIGQKQWISPPGRVRLINVSEGGCCFGSELRFPVRSGMLLELSWPSEAGSLALPGNVVWRSPAEEGYRHGMQFSLSGAQRSALIGRLNAVLLELCPDQTKIHALYRKLSSAVIPHSNEEASS